MALVSVSSDAASERHYTFGTLAGAAAIDGSGSAAQFVGPIGVAVDSAGTVYVADRGNSTIRKITPTGVVTTLAGSAGERGSTNGTGSAARFDSPEGVTVDSAGTVYVGDYGNDTIRKITPAGAVTNLAPAGGGIGYRVSGVAVDSAGTVYWAETGSANVIMKLPAGGQKTVFAGTIGQSGSTDGTVGVARFNGPRGVAVDSAGTVYVADERNHTIRAITPEGVVTTLAGTAGVSGSAEGTGSAARFNHPWGVAVDGAGTVYVADESNHTIRAITSARVVTTLAGTAGANGSTDGAGSAARFSSPEGVAVDGGGTVYVGDTGNNTIRRITPGGVVTTLAGTPGGADGTGSAARFAAPDGVAVDDAGTVYVADTSNSTIRKITTAGVVTTLAGAVGQPGSTDGIGSAARFNNPQGVAVDSAGTVYVADTSNSTIRKVTSAGAVTTLAGTAGQTGSADGTGSAARFRGPSGVAVDAAGTVYVADRGNYTIRKITPTGEVTTLAGLAGQGGISDGTGSEARFGLASGIAADTAGTVYVADTTSHTIRQITPAGVVTTLAGLAEHPGFADGTGGAARFFDPGGVAVDSAGTVYVADSLDKLFGNHTIRRITPAGVVTTLAGAPGLSGSADGAGSAARFKYARGVAVNSAGTVYVADTGNNTIRRAAKPTPAITPTPGDYDGDNKADLTLFRPSNGTWFTRQSTTGFATSTGQAFGQSGDVPVPGDYDGDGQGDLAVWRPSTGVWFILTSSSHLTTAVLYQWGLSTDLPVPGDYDGDGKTDLAVYRPSTGVWYVELSTTNYATTTTVGLGLSTDIPVPADYDGDGRTDVAVYRPSTGRWYIRQSSIDFTTAVSYAWGASGDVPVPGDYDGDGKSDVAVWRPSTGVWYAALSTTNFTTAVSYQWGASGDTPVPADFDGDGITDLAVYRPASGTWWIRTSTTNYATTVTSQWGTAGDVPAPNAPVANAVALASGKATVSSLANLVRVGDTDGDGKADFTVWRPSTGAWYVLQSSVNYTTAVSFELGSSGDIPVSGDFDGDGKADIAILVRYPDNTYNWIFRLSSGTAYPIFEFGITGDIPVLGDYDGDGRTDVAQYRPSSGVWFIRQSSTNPTTSVSYPWGVSTDTPVPGDYDGDGVTDLAVYRPSTGVWYILQSTTNYTTSVAYQWGLSGDVTVPGDYDGDGKTDIAVYRPSTGVWYLLKSGAGYATAASFQFGLSTDVPVPSDFDGDGKTDIAVYRPSSGVWFILASSTNFTTSSILQWGASGDIPVLRRQ